MSLVPVATHPLMHPKHAVEAHMRQRHTIIKGLASGGMSNHRVIDFMHCISDSNEAPNSRLTSIEMHTHSDKIHLTTRGYEKLAATIISTTEQLVQQKRDPATGGMASLCRGMELTGWHGFICTTGYGRFSRVTPNYGGRGRGVRHHPYKRF